jgi:hypothetical protein
MEADEEIAKLNRKPGDEDWSINIEDLLPKF